MKRIFITSAFGALFFAAVAGSCSTARANLDIIPIWDSTVTSDSNAATVEATIDTAISNIEGDIANTETIYIKFQESPNVFGESATPVYSVSYNNYLSALENDQILSSQDSTALASLGLTAPFTSNPTTNPANGGTKIDAAGPLLRRLGFTQGVNGTLITSSSSSPDSTITFNGNEEASVLDDSIETPPYYESSLESVVSHELDEVLSIGGGGSQLNRVRDGSVQPTGAVGPLDLYRYSSPGVRSYTTGTGATAYFSIDGGNTNLDYFNQGAEGSDYADWGNGTPGSTTGNTPAQVQDAWGQGGTAPQLGSSELTALDVVGWNLTSQGQGIEASAVPEPAAYASILLGGLFLAGLRRRKTG